MSAPPEGRRSDVSMNIVDPPAQNRMWADIQYIIFSVGLCMYVSVFPLTQCSPCQPHSHSWRGDIVHTIHCEKRFPHVLLQVFRCNSHCGLFTTDDTECHLTENLMDG